MILLPDQLSAHEKLCHYKAGALFMEPGTGKTLAALELVRPTDCDLLLWLTPFQNKANMAAEFTKWGYAGAVEIVGIESLSSSDRVYLETLRKVEAARACFMVVDESLLIKNGDATRTKRILGLGRKSEFRLILNGTPITRDLLDLWAQMEFLHPQILGCGFAEFKSRYCVVKKMIPKQEQRGPVKEWVSGYANLDHLYSRINRYVYGCDLKLELQKKHYDVTVAMPEREEDEYGKVKDKYLNLEKLQQMNNNIFLGLCQELQQSYSMIPAKVNLAKEAIRQHGPALIFTKFIKTFEQVTALFPECTVLSYGKHALGLNLQHYSHTIFWEQTWDYAKAFQAEGRTYRTGQVEDCHYTHILVDNKLDAMIRTNQSRKGGLLARFKELGSTILEEL